MAKKNKQRITTVGFIALGCPKNIVDSERMLAEIAQAELVVTADIENADVVVINTCGFIAPAKLEALETIKHVVTYKKRGSIKKVIVAGCLCERMGEELFNEAEGIDTIMGLGQRDEIARIIQKTISDKDKSSYLEHSYQPVKDDRTRLLITPSHSAYLRISEGCDHKCSFCTVPAIRGRFRSKPLDMILAEASELAKAGVVELNIIAQDTAYYGRDLKIKDGLVVLLEELEKIAGLQWLRLMYLYPVGFTEKLIETIGTSEKIVHYLDIPLQHINNKILRDMRRPDSKENICQLIKVLKETVSDIILRTTLIVGFPGETDGQFDELVEFIKWARFDALGVFKYYAESGTDAAKMTGQVPEEIKEQRLKKLMLTQQNIAFAKNRERVGSEFVCLVDSVDKRKTGRGRFYGQAPEIDSVCIIENCSATAGDFVKVKVIGTKDYDLIVRQI